jgi:hypothetical protein
MTKTVKRSIEQILAIRVQAAQMRVDHRTTALTEATDEDRAEMEEAKKLADEALVLARREAAQQQGQDVEHLKYAPSTTFALKRYALILMQNDLNLSHEDAMEQTWLDERARFEDYCDRYLDEE